MNNKWKANFEIQKKRFVKYVQFAEIENKLVELNSKIINVYEEKKLVQNRIYNWLIKSYYLSLINEYSYSID